MIIYIWTVASLVGAVIAAWNLGDAWRDLRALDSTVINGRRILAEGWVRREVVRFGIQAVWSLIGFLALPTADAPVNPLAILLLSTNLAVMTNTLLDAHERIKLRRIING